MKIAIKETQYISPQLKDSALYFVQAMYDYQSIKTQEKAKEICSGVIDILQENS